jgi:hypothetical protein
VDTQLKDESDIRTVLVRYCRGVDRLDLDLLRSVYHPDATDDHGIYSGPVEGFLKFIANLPARGFQMTQHCLYQTLFDINEDIALTETYFTSYHRLQTEAGTAEERSGARYLDRFERRASEWRIAHRQVVVDWGFMSSPLPPLRNMPSFAQGTHELDDPSFAHLSWALQRGDE